MTTTWEDQMNLFRDSKYKLLVTEYCESIEMAADKQYAHYEISNNFHRIFQDIQNDSSSLQNVGGSIINLRRDIVDLLKRNKNFNYSTAFEHLISTLKPTSTKDEKEKVIEKLAEIEAYSLYYKFIEIQTNHWKNIELQEKSANQINDSETNDIGNFTMKQQLLLLHILGFLDISVIKDIENTKKAKLISMLLNRDDENIRKALSSLNGNSVRTPENIRKVNDLLKTIGLTELIIK